MASYGLILLYLPSWRGCLLSQLKCIYFSSCLIMENDPSAGFSLLCLLKLSPFPCCGFNNASFHEFADFNVLLLNL